MKTHQFIFEKVRIFLRKHFGSNLKEYEEGQFLTIEDTGIWISCSDTELTVGYGVVHTHYDPEFDDIQAGLDQFFNLLTSRKRVTKYYKGKSLYKHKTELELDDSEYENIGTAITWLYPYWRKTEKEVLYEDSLIDPIAVKAEIEEIKNYTRQNL